MPLLRLNKYLADLGLASRREADALIADGKVLINNLPATLGQKVDPDTDTVTIAKETIEQKEQNQIYYLLHKPAGYTTSSKHTRQDPHIVLDLVPDFPRVFPVGRLDRDTTGLLILTNDGVLAYRLTHPSFECEKEYEVELDTPLTPERVRKIETGVRLEHVPTKPTRIRVHDTNLRRARIIITEGKNRQVRKIFGKVGCEVLNLRRLRIKNLHIGNLSMSRWRELTQEEVRDLKSL